MILAVPQDATLYPTLGPQVCDFIEQNLVFGPGDLRGQPARLDEEKVGLIYRMYEVYPKGHTRAGRRRFKRVGISLRKGLAKTELAAWIAACELHAEAPVRCIDWTPEGDPIGGGVTDPYIPLVAYTEEQSDDLAYTALRVILELSTLKDDFDIGLERILRKRGGGKAVALAAAPDARDGARTTFQHFDETHRFTLPRLVRAHRTMLANIPKRRGADAWTLETTTAPEPGTGSVAESAMEYARAIKAGHVTDPRLFYFHREASAHHDVTTDAGLRAAILEASGTAVSWSDTDSIAAEWQDPETDKAYLERVWLNRVVKGGTQAFDVAAWEACAREARPVQPKDRITIGFDGAMFHDSTGIVATHIATGFQWVPGLWERPLTLRPEQAWQVPVEEVDATMRALFAQYDVWRLYADPPYWQSWIALWAGDPAMGSTKVFEWWTTRQKPMAYALKNYDTAIKSAELSHDADARLARHLGNSRRQNLPGQCDEQGRPLWLIRKERPDSPHKIDLAMAAVLSWEARTDALAAGVLSVKTPQYEIYVFGGSPG